MPRADEQVFIKVDGRQLDLGAAKLVRVTLEQALLLPDAFDIVLDGGLEWLHDDTFAIGKEVELELAQDTASRRRLLKGEITGLMPSMTGSNEVLLHVRGYDRSHRLQRGRYTRSFIQMKDSDIAQRIAQELGLGTDVEPTSEVHDYVLQHNLTNLEFLQSRAASIGYQVGVAEGSLYFKPVGEPPAKDGQHGEIELEWGEGLEEFEVSRSTPGQATEVVVRGWDPKRKKAVVGQSRRSEAGPETKRDDDGGAAAKKAFGMDAVMTVCSEDASTQAAAERMAQVISDELHGCYTTADGVARGNPNIRPGASLKVGGVGVFEGSYQVSSARHNFSQDGYSTSFTVDGARTPRTPLAVGQAPAASVRGVWLSVGTVTDNQDPQNAGRVKVKLPALADELESDWCRLLTPMAGPNRGVFFLPEAGDEVLVAFEAGAGGQPVIIGSLWNGQDAPPLSSSQAVASGAVVQRVIKSRAGHTILLDDTRGQEKVSIEDKNGTQVVMESGQNSLTIRSKGNLTLVADGQIDIRATGTLNIRGATVNIN